MTAERLARLARMDATEVGWRIRALARIGCDRFQSALRPPQWDRALLLSRLAPLDGLQPARAALASRRWEDAHRELTRYFTAAPQRFVIAASNRSTLVSALHQEYPAAAQDAVVRADRILDGTYDLLGYQGLRFDPAHHTPSEPGVAIDWQCDPVHNRRPPRAFWSTVAYLDPACGDHKIIWEINRHQHWLALGRAYWLTDDARYRDRCLSELHSWLEDNPPLVGINWSSMLELGLRSLSWLWVLPLFVDARHRDRRPWTVDLLLGLDRQLTQIERNLSYYFSPNTHLIGEALALYVTGRALPELAASGRHERLGRRILVQEIARQIACDGGHREQSTHYHRYMLDFYLLALTVARITADPVAASFKDAVERLASAARCLADDSGRLPTIGDDDGGGLWPVFNRSPNDIRDSLSVASALLERPDLRTGPVPEEALWWCASPALAPDLCRLRSDTRDSSPLSTALPDTGYYVSRSAAGEHIVIDGGPHGYRNGGHAHADALSLTMTLGGMPLLIDPGTGSYTVDREVRDRLRSTAFHNTLALDGRSQSVPSGPFQWASVANTRALCWRTTPAFDYFVGAHDGYRPAEHRRHVLVLHGDLLLVADFVGDTGSHEAAVHWHIDPRWSVQMSDRRFDFTHAGRFCQLLPPPGRLEVFVGDRPSGLGWHAPVYGPLQPAISVRVVAHAVAPFWMVSLFGFDAMNSIRDAELLEPEGEPGLPSAARVRISRDRTVDEVSVTSADLTFSRRERHQPTPRIVASLHMDTVCAA